jgi:hypothetical protein
MRGSIASGDRTVTRAAASSTASGRSSRRSQTAATAASFSSVSSKVGSGGACALGEELDRLLLAEGRNGIDALAPDAQRLPARRDHRQPGRGGEQLGDAGGGRQQLLQVVEDEQQLLAGEKARDRLAGVEVDSDRLGDLDENELRILDRCEADEEGAVGEVVGELGGGLQRQSGLARAAGTRECDEPHARRSHERAEIVELAAPADESGRLQGEVRRPAARI